MDPIQIQKRIRDNAEELQEFANSLKNWEQEMKTKEEQLLKLKSEENNKINEITSAKKEEQILKHEEADLHKKKGNDFVKVSKWKEALEEYSTSISLYPNDAIYYGNRSFCHMQLQNWKEAENDCNRALELKPDYVKVALRRANVRRKRGNIHGAAKDYNLVLVLEPKNVTALKEYEEIYPELKAFCADLGINLPEFAEMNPSSKNEKDDEPKNTDGRSANKKSQKKEFQLVYPTSIKVNKVNKDNPSKIAAQKNKKNENSDNFSVIEPEKYKPPHLRSKLPLRRIQIEDVYLNSDDNLAMFP